MASKTWFITGTSRGFGREWTKAALERGDRVAATARDVSTLEDLKAEHGDALLALPRRHRPRRGVRRRHAGPRALRTPGHRHQQRRLRPLRNGGGALRAGGSGQIETNLFGALWVTQAALPFLREQGSGHIVQVSSIGGISAFPSVGIYHASKWALEGISQALAQEVKEFGIDVTLVEPGGFSTDWSGPSSKRSEPNPAYDGLRERQQQWRASNVPGDPTASAAAIMRVVDANPPPLRVFFGTTPLGIAEAITRAAWRPGANGSRSLNWPRDPPISR